MIVKESQNVSLQDVVKALIDEKPMLVSELLKVPNIAQTINNLLDEDDTLDFDVAERFAVLHLACTISAPIFVTILLNHGADPNQTDSDGKYPIHKACSSGRDALEKVQILVALSTENIDRRDELTSQTPLHRAAVKGNIDVVEFLLENGADRNSRDKRGETALHKAAFTNRAHVLQALLASGVPVNQQDDEGHTALHVACSYACLDAIKVLTQDSNCDLSVKNIEHETALDVALMKEQQQIVDYMKQMKMKTENKNKSGAYQINNSNETTADGKTEKRDDKTSSGTVDWLWNGTCEQHPCGLS